MAEKVIIIGGTAAGLSAELDHFHVLDFGGGGKESGGAKVSV